MVSDSANTIKGAGQDTANTVNAVQGAGDKVAHAGTVAAIERMADLITSHLGPLLESEQTAGRSDWSCW